VVVCAENYKSKFKFLEVIQEKVQSRFFGHGVHV